MYKLKFGIGILLISLLSINSLAQIKLEDQWPSFRGYRANGTKDGANTPIDWNVSKGENLNWKVEIPGLGHSCPIVWGDRIYITTAISASGKDDLKVGLYGDIDEDKDESIHEFKIYCLDKNTGKVIWEKLAHKGVPSTKRHTKASHANCTPATDGKHLVVFFGSEGLFCYDMEGNLSWKKELGRLNAGPFTDPDVEWGFASSPIIHENYVIIQCDVIGDCFIAAFDIDSGEELWRNPREEVATWCTPTIYYYDDEPRIAVNGYKHIGGYDLKYGKEVWRMHGGGDAPTPAPVFYDGLIYFNNAHGKMSPIYAVKPNAVGDITLSKDDSSNEHIQWSIKRGGAYMQTPVIYDGLLYNLQVNGLLTVFDAKTGKQMYREKIGTAGFTASGIVSDGKVYFSEENGDVFVVKAGPEYELLAKNSMEDVIMATPAITDNAIIYRTQHYVISVGTK